MNCLAKCVYITGNVPSDATSTKETKRLYIYHTKYGSTDGHGLGSLAIHLAHHCFSFNMNCFT